jgi:hypothetical protein
MVPPTAVTRQGLDPDVFLTQIAWVEVPAVIFMKHGTVARYAPISVVVRFIEKPCGYAFVASMLAVVP